MLLFSNALEGIAVVLKSVLDLYIWVILIAVLLTWLPPHLRMQYPTLGSIAQALNRMTEPVFYWVRRRMPFTYTSGMDFSPIVVILAIELVNRILVRSVIEYSMQLR